MEADWLYGINHCADHTSWQQQSCLAGSEQSVLRGTGDFMDDLPSGKMGQNLSGCNKEGSVVPGECFPEW